MSFGDKLEKLKEERGVSAREIARRLGLRSSTTVANWILGAAEPRLSQAVELARYFGVPLSHLAYEEEPAAEGGLGDDEQTILKLYRALGLSPDEALRRLAGHGASRGDSDGPGLGRQHLG